jgi:capsular exopolysaccharide synthesis family protein
LAEAIAGTVSAAPAPFRFEPAPDEERFNPLTWVFRALRYRKLIIAVLTLGIVAGVMITAMEAPRYAARTRIEILPQAAKVVEDLQVVREVRDTWGNSTILTARERLLSHGLAQRVVYDLNLAENPAFLTSRPRMSISNLINRAFRLESTPNIREMPRERREAIAIGRVRGGLSIRPVQGTSIIDIVYLDQNPRMAALVADQIARSYIEQRIDETSETSATARRFIEEQVSVLKERLQASEQALVDYAREQNLTITGDNSSLISANLTQTNSALADARKERLEFERLVKFIDEGRGADLPQVVENKGIEGLRARVAELRGEYREKLATLKPAFPEMRQLQARITELERQIDRTVAVIVDSIRLKHADTVATEQSLKDRLRELEKEQADFQDKSIRYTILKREVDSNRSQYQNLINKMNELGVGSEIRNPSAAIIDRASIPGGPSTPVLMTNLAISILISLILTAMIIYVIELLNNTFSTPDEIEGELGVPALGVLPELPAAELREQLENHNSAISEAYRSLRTSIQFSGVDGTPRTILVTSSEPGEGKSTTAFKLALDLGALGAKVLLIDADLRKPSLHRYFATDHAIGLSNVLTNTGQTGETRDLFRPTKYENVTFMTSGVLPPNPADLLSSQRMALLLTACGKHFDVIIVDSPPVIGLADAPALARIVEGTLLVVASNYVTRKAARIALKRLRSSGATILGAALTKHTADRFAHGYNYRYSKYGYYQYGAETPRLEANTDGARVPAHPLHAALARLSRRVRDAGARLVKRNQPTA